VYVDTGDIAYETGLIFNPFLFIYWNLMVLVL
jgi:hypothetical protein